MTYKAHKAWGIYFVGNKNKNGPDWALGYWILAPKWTAQDVTFKGQWHISASLYLMRLYTVVSPWHFLKLLFCISNYVTAARKYVLYIVWVCVQR